MEGETAGIEWKVRDKNFKTIKDLEEGNSKDGDPSKVELAMDVQLEH